MAYSVRVDEILAFLETVDRLKSVYRAAYLADLTRHENAAEHCWHACLFALLLHRECAQPVEIGRVLELLLIHDLVEVYAGDTFAYDPVGTLDQAVREAAAAQRLFGLL